MHQDLRGRMIRSARQMKDEDARAFLLGQKIAYIGSVDENGWPYVVPLVYIYQGGDTIWATPGINRDIF